VQEASDKYGTSKLNNLKMAVEISSQFVALAVKQTGFNLLRNICGVCGKCNQHMTHH